MDHNNFIRLILLSICLTLYLYIFKPKPVEKPAEQPFDQKQAISTTALSATPFVSAIQGQEKEIVVENAWYKITLSTKGGMIKRVLLKKYKDKHGQSLLLLDEQTNQMGLSLPYQGAWINMKDLYFTTPNASVYNLKDKDQQQIHFCLALSPTQYLEQIFEFSGDNYKINYAWKAVGMQDYFDKTHAIHFNWHMDMKDLETDTKADMNRSTINYYLSNGIFKHLKENSQKLETQKLNTSMKWISIKQRFFCSAIIAHQDRDCFQTGQLTLQPSSLPNTTKSATLSLALSSTNQEEGHGKFTFFFGPNDYATLKKITKEFQQNLPLGWAIVRFVNQGLIIPIFYALENYFSCYGLIIGLLVVIVKLLLAPLSYKAFLSMAKMKLIKPELDKIKKQHGNNLQKIQTEQLLLYRELGINPLSSFVPILLQIPILLAMFNFFPNAIGLRQKPFLWASDLSTYDSILTLPFSIPMYGKHVSLFTLFMVSSMLILRSGTQSQEQNFMNKLSYIMPFSFMLILNSFPAGLSFYYCLSNLITGLQQKVTHYFVNEQEIQDKLLAKQKRRRQKTTSFQERVISSIQNNNKKRH